MKIQFVVDKNQLLFHTMERFRIRKVAPFPEWEILENKIREKYQNGSAYYFLVPTHTSWAIEELWRQSFFESVPAKKLFSGAVSEMDKIRREVQKSEEFKRLYKETRDYSAITKKRWEEKEKEIFSFIKNVSGVSIPNISIKIFIDHPNINTGCSFSDKNIIYWGHPEDWENYSVVYICHEIMHGLTKQNEKNKNIMHALIELMTDNELRIKLNKKGKYFKENGLEIGHYELRALSEKIMPYWEKYLKKRNYKNIFELEEYLIKKGIA